MFTCNICKKAPLKNGWSRNCTWKTQRGFDNHKCYKDEQSRMAEQAEKRKKRLEEDLKKAIETAEYSVGETVYFWGYTVTKPTHVYKSGRMARVRYEEERNYWSDFGKITEIAIGGYKVGMRHVHKWNICKTIDEATEQARLKQEAYKESCEFASRCR